MTIEHEAGVINPYALADVLSGRPIDWSRVDRDEHFQAIFGCTVDQLLYGGPRSPLFSTLRLDAARRAVLPLTPAERIQRVSQIGFDANLRATALARLSTRLSIPGEVLGRQIASNVERLREALRSVVAEASSGPWTPALSEWWDPGDFYEEGTEALDPIQGALGDCWLIAALSSTAWTEPDVISHRNRTVGASQQDFVDLFALRGGSGAVVKLEASERLPVTQSTHQWIYARSREASEIWPGMYEKAFAKLVGNVSHDQPNYGVLDGGSPVFACSAVVNRPGTAEGVHGKSVSDVWNKIRAQCDSNGRARRPLVAWTYPADHADNPGSLHYKEINLVEWHAYSIFGAAVLGGKRYVILRNPWGQHEATGGTTWSGSLYGLSLPGNGCFALLIDSFMSYFRGFGWA